MKPLIMALAVSLILVGPSATSIAQAPKTGGTDQSVGTWALNVQKSRLPGPAPRAFTERYDSRADGFVVGTRVVIASDGNPAFEQVAFKYDGKDYEWWDNAAMAEFLATGKRTPKTLSVKPRDARTVEYVGKQAGNVIVTGQRTVSSDGTLMTFSGKSLDAQGNWLAFEALFDRR